MYKTKEDKILLGTITVIVSIVIFVLSFLFRANTVLSDRITNNNEVLTKKVNTVSSQYTNIQTQLSQIQTDIGWLKTNRFNIR